MYYGGYILSPNGRYKAQLACNGNFMVLDMDLGGSWVWGSGTPKSFSALYTYPYGRGGGGVARG